MLATGPGQTQIVVQIDQDFKEIVPRFLDNRLKDLKTILDCLEQSNFQSIQMVGHRMKGSGGGYGFHLISEIGDGLEQAAINHDPPEICRYLAELTSYLGCVQIVWRD